MICLSGSSRSVPGTRRTRHAPVNGRTDALADYDNTGTVAAAVRAGDDAHEIWLVGRIIPGTSPKRLDELRLSGVSGNWRGITAPTSSLPRSRVVHIEAPRTTEPAYYAA